MFIATRWFSSQARKAFRKARVEIGSVNADLQENIAAVREVQAFSREDENIEQFRASNAANRDANIRAQAFTSALGPTLEALSAFFEENPSIGKKVIEKVIREYKKLFSVLEGTKDEIKGDLKIGVIPTLAPYLIPLFVEQFTKNFPKINLILEDHKTESIISHVVKPV